MGLKGSEMAMRWTTAGGLAAASLILLAFQAHADDAPARAPPVDAKVGPEEAGGGWAGTVDDLVSRALARSPAAEALKARYFASLRTVRPAGALADPIVEVSYRNEGRPWDPMREGSMAEVAVTQAFPYPGKRDSRREAALATAQVAEAEAREWQQRLIAQVRTLYARLYALDRERDILRASSDLLDLLQATIASRYATGQADQEALVKVQVEGLRVRERLAEVQAQREEFVAALIPLLDESSSFSMGPVQGLPEVSPPAEGVEDQALAYGGIIAVARARLEAAKRRLAAARLETRPDFFVGLAGGSTLVPEPVLALRFGVEVPFWASEKQEPRIQEALFEVRAAEAELREKEAMVRSELRSVLARFRRAEELTLVYREGIVPQATLAFEAAIAAYRAGTGDFSTVIEDFRGLLEARILLERLKSDRYAAWAGLQELVTPIPSIEEEPR